MTDNRYDLLRNQIREALDILEKDGAPATVAMQELVKFLVAIGLAANGPVNTIAALRDLTGQLEGVFPKSAALLHLAGRPVDGHA